MNRRKFLVGAIIIPIGAIAAAKYQLAEVLPTGYVSEGVTKLKSYLYVVPTQKQAWALYNELGRPRNAKVISVGGPICGYGADVIVIDENWRKHDGSVIRRDHLENWFNETVRTRLFPGGKIITKRLT